MTTELTAGSSDSRDKRLLGYTLAAGAAALGVTGNSEAAISYSGIQNFAIPVDTAGFLKNYNIDLNGDSYTDIIFANNYNAAYGSFYKGAFSPTYGTGFAGTTNGVVYVSNLSTSDTVDASIITDFSGSMAFAGPYGNYNANAEFTDVTDGYIGLSFFINPSDPVHYGWMRVDVSSTTGTFILKDWAYETTPGEAIAVGAVPEPGTLGLLAAGVAGLAAHRRRRQAAG